MRNDTAPVIRLKDYKVPDFLIDSVDLDIGLKPHDTSVRAKLCIRRNPAGTRGASLVLDGDELRLRSARLNGEALSEGEYKATESMFVLHAPPAGPFELEIETLVDPEGNTKLMGLYRSNGVYCTQCEAEGFRRITYFIDRPDVMAVYTVRLEAELEEAPVLLSNGNPVYSGPVEGTTRHFAVWHDPHPKPSYLFALVGGNLGSRREDFTTATGRRVKLGVYVEKGKENQADYAMDALRRSMRWDEQVFGCPYDLDVFNIVAVSDFNMGAMENKGLNIFNDKYVLATPRTATDLDYANIEAIIAHEYFHNWTGNRITCRDWFQLCLKEGLTVFRDQEFSSDMRSRSVKRIEDVLDLRERQFGEDAGPLAHPVRPPAYTEINNFYTATIYEKGAEIVRMLKTIMGAAAFKRGMDLYLTRCDGTAATVEDFISCFAEAGGLELDQFMLWYEQAGTPILEARRSYDPERRVLKLNLEQRLSPTPGQKTKDPMVIPVTVAMIGAEGRSTSEHLFVLSENNSSFEIADVGPNQVPSMLRRFSAPVSLDTDLNNDELAILAKHDDDAFNRWQSIQTLALRLLVDRVRLMGNSSKSPSSDHVAEAFEAEIGRAGEDMAFAAFALKLPSCQEIARTIGTDVDPSAIHDARERLKTELGRGLSSALSGALDQIGQDAEYRPDAGAAAKRAFTAALLSLLAAASPEDAKPLLIDAANSASNMTDRARALHLLTTLPGNEREEALAKFARDFADTPLALDKWFAMHASIAETGTIDRIRSLMAHEHFSMTNPNRFRSLIGTFAFANYSEFNRRDGEGYRFIGGLICEIDSVNPQVSARMATAFRTWKCLESVRRTHARSALDAIRARTALSVDMRDIIDRTLA